jgi:hypothetical protein
MIRKFQPSPRRRWLLTFLLALAPACRREAPIRITPEIQAALEEERAELLGRGLTDAERSRLREDWLDQEILVREAYRLGLDKGDGVVRRRLLEKMRSLLAEETVEPSREVLLAYYNEHEALYVAPELVSLDHVLLGEKERGSRDAASLLETLKKGADHRKLGQRFWLGASLVRLSSAELGRVLGDDFAKAVFALPDGEWSGPLESIRGLHLVRVTARRPRVLRPFEEVLVQVREDWQAAEERDVLERKIAEMAAFHRVEGRAARTPGR